MRRSLLLDFSMARKAGINGAPEGGCYISHEMYGPGSLRKENT